MARIAFISLYDRNAYGLRLMSANLKRHGHECHIIFLKRYNTDKSYLMKLEVGEYPWMGINKSGRVFKYASNSHVTPTELELLRATLARIRPDVIGLTVNTPLRVQNAKVTRFLKQHITAPIIWGGYDPTVNAADCLRLCDYACIGEGDQAILDIASCVDRGRPFDDVCNVAYVRDGRTVFNSKAPAEQDIDRYPWRDNSPEHKYFIEDDRLEENYPVINDKPEGAYQTMSARGCPYKCSYCCEATFKQLYSGEKFLRRRSPRDFVAELAQAKEQFRLREVIFEDEIFAMNLRWLQEFAPLYRDRIGLPFTAYIYPTRNIERILELLKHVGLSYCCLALESGSERISKAIFDRVYDRSLFLHTVGVCKRLRIDFYTDVITYNPYEEEADLKKTLNVLLDMGGGFDMCINKLFVLPGTKLAELMARDGLVIGDSAKDRLFDYHCRLFWIASFTPHARSLVRLIEGVGLFRRHPALLNPAFVEAALHPLACSAALASWLGQALARGWCHLTAGRTPMDHGRATPVDLPTVCR